MVWTILLVVIQVGLGLFYGNLMEWAAHKYLLHKLGKNKNSKFSFHWHEHHRKSRLNQFYDDDYDKPIWNWNARGKEAVGLLLLWVIHSWIFFFFPIFAIAITYCVFNYYFTHKWAHENPQWAKEHLRCHWEHHMGKNQEANFCVTQPWSDYLFGTRIHYREEKTKTGKNRLVPIEGRISL